MRIPFLLGACLLVASCSEKGATGSPTIWALDSIPEIRIAPAETAQAGQLGRITALLALHDGSIVAADLLARDLKLFGPDGQLRRVIGRSGSGPREFRLIAQLLRSASDSFLVWDAPRVYTINASGEFINEATVNPPAHSTGRTQGYWLLPNGAFLGQAGAAGATGSGRTRPAITYLMWAATGDPVPIATLPGQEIYVSSTGVLVSPLFPHQTEFAIGDSLFYLGDNASDSIQVFDLAGRHKGVIRISEGARFATAEEAKRAAADRLRWAQRRGRESDYQALMPQLIDFRDLPLYGALRAGPGGTLWVQRFAPSGDSATTWSVFDTVGQQVATVRTPPRFMPMDIRSDYVLGTSKDGLDRDEIHRYRIRK